LPFTPFAHCDPNPGHIFVFVACHQLEIDRLCRAVVEHHATPPDIECLVGDIALQRHLVHFGMPITRMAEFLGQFAIVGQQHQSLAVGIKPPDRIQMLADRDKIEYGAAMLLFLRAYRRDNAHRFVEHHIDALTLDAQARTLDADIVMLGIGFIAKFRDSAIDRHKSLLDQGFGIAPRGNARLSDEFLKSLFHQSSNLHTSSSSLELFTFQRQYSSYNRGTMARSVIKFIIQQVSVLAE
jgi:hypothetical protein